MSLIVKPNRFLDPVMKEAANKFGIPLYRIQECIAAQFELTRDSVENYNSKIQQGEKVIYLPKFGKFLIPSSREDRLREKYKDYKEGEDNETIHIE